MDVLFTPRSPGSRHETLPFYHPFMSDIVGNTICADLLDYLVRDGKRLKLDTRDNPRIQRYLVVRPASSFAIPSDDTLSAKPELRLTITAVSASGLRRRDTVSDLLDLMRERYRFAEVVYYHAKKAAFSTMLAKAVELLRTKEPESLRDGEGIYPAPWARAVGALAAPSHIAHFGDQALISHSADLWQERPRRLRNSCEVFAIETNISCSSPSITKPPARQVAEGRPTSSSPLRFGQTGVDRKSNCHLALWLV